MTGRTTEDVMPDVFVVATAGKFLRCVHERNRESGGCDACWRVMRRFARLADQSALTQAILHCPERPWGCSDADGRRWALGCADWLADIGAAADSAARLYDPRELTAALDAIHAVGERAAAKAKADAAAAAAERPRAAHAVPWTASAPTAPQSRRRRRRRGKR